MTSLKFLNFMACFAILVHSSTAAVLVQYTFSTGTDSAANATFSATTSFANTTHSSITAGAGITIQTLGTNTASGTYVTTTNTISNTGGAAADYTVFAPVGFAETTIADAVANNDYFQFTLEADGAFELDLSSIYFDAASGGDSSSTRQFQLRYSTDGFTTHTALATETASPITGSIAPFQSNWLRYTYSLASLPDTSDTVTFRIYGTTGHAVRQIRFDNLTVEGSVIPEPSTYVLLSAGLAMIVILRRRHKSRMVQG